MDWKTERKTLTTVEVCGKLGMSRPTLMKWVLEGKIKSIQKGRGTKHRFSNEEVERILNGH